ncbi:MAG TPA: hypothetical protein PK189_06745, partial [bacterium]|nr:hypothetical protein [bacterium]
MNIIKVSLIISLILFSNLLSYNFSNRIYNYLSSLDIYQTEENIERSKKIRSNNNLAEEEKEIIDMIVALLSIKTKNNYEMEKCLLNIIREGKIFRDYAVLFISEYYIKKKEYNKAKELIIRELRENETILTIEFYKMLLDINTKTGLSNNITYYETLVKYIQEDEYFLERYKTEVKEYEYRLAEMYYKNNLKYEALNIIKKIIINDGAYKRDSIKLLQQMIKSNKNLIRELNDEIISEIIKENIVNKNYKEAIAYTEEIKNIKDKILLLANCYIKMRNYKNAEKVLENIKGSREYKLKKAEIFKINKQTNKAKENLIEIIKEDKRDRNEERALEIMLEILYNEMKYKEAMRYYNYLATYYPENKLLSEYLWNIGFCFFERREFDEAERCFRMLSEYQRNKNIRSDEKAKVLFWVALSNEKNNRYGEAIKIYNEI